MGVYVFGYDTAALVVEGHEAAGWSARRIPHMAVCVGAT